MKPLPHAKQVQPGQSSGIFGIQITALLHRCILLQILRLLFSIFFNPVLHTHDQFRHFNTFPTQCLKPREQREWRNARSASITPFKHLCFSKVISGRSKAKSYGDREAFQMQIQQEEIAGFILTLKSFTCNHPSLKQGLI